MEHGEGIIFFWLHDSCMCTTFSCRLPSRGRWAERHKYTYGDELLETNTGGRLRHGHRLNRAGRRPRLHTNTSRSYKQLLSYVSNGLQGHLPKNTSDVPKCSCVMDGHEGDLNVAVLKITLVILGLWAISAGSLCTRVFTGV